MAVGDQNIDPNSIAAKGISETDLGVKSKAATAGAVSSQIAQDAKQADITNEDLFPGMNQKINVGSSTSQTLGTQPIFVAAGQYVPYNILNKKEEAIAAAAKKRAERQAKFDPAKAAPLKNKLYQRDLNNSFNDRMSDIISTAQTMDPDNWDKNLNNPGTEIGKLYAQQQSNFNVLAEESNVLFEKVAQVIADKETGGPTLNSEFSRNLAYEIQNKSGDAVDGKSLEDLRPLVDKFNGSYDLDNHLATNNVVTQMKADITSLMIPEHGGMTMEETKDWSARIEAYAESETATEAGRYFNDDLIKKQDIVDRLSSMLGLQKTRTHKEDRPVPQGNIKRGEEKERVKLRSRNILEAQNDPEGPIAKAIIDGTRGTEFGGGKIRNASVLGPKHWDETKKGLVDPLVGIFREQKQKFDAKTFYTNSNLQEAIKKQAKQLGVKDRVTVSVDKDASKAANSDVFNVKIGSEKMSLDLNDEDSVEDFTKLFMRANHGGDDFRDENVYVLDIADNEGGTTHSERANLKDPNFVAIVNTVLNKNVGQDKKVDLDEVLEEMGVANAGTGHLQKQNTREETDAAIKKKKEGEKKASQNSAPKTFDDLKKNKALYEASVKSTMQAAKVDSAGAVEMIKNHYKIKK